MGSSEVEDIQLYLFKKKKGEVVVAHIYVDGIVFGSTKDDIAQDFHHL